MVKNRWPVYVALLLLIAITLAFVLMFVIASEPVEHNTAAPDTDIYRDRVDDLLAHGDPERGAALVTAYTCVTCHVIGVEVGIAPPFAGVADRAADRRPPLSAASYMYESIMTPTAYVVEGYSGAMPENFSERLSDDDLGDILAYLLTQTL